MTEMGNADGGVLFIGTKGKLMADCYGANQGLFHYQELNKVKQPAVAQTIQACSRGTGSLVTMGKCMYCRLWKRQNKFTV